MPGNNATETVSSAWIHDRRVQPANAFTFVSFSDSTDLTFVDLSAESANHRENVSYCRGFHANTSGTVVIVPPGNEDNWSQVSLEVTAGQYYPYSVKRFKLTGATFGDASTWNDHIVAWR